MALLIACLAARERVTAALPELRTTLEAEVTTCWAGFTDCRSDVARAEKMELLWGVGTIEEQLNGVRYRISPYSFFQTNSRGTERLYSLLGEWGQACGRGAMMDLYCGSGDTEGFLKILPASKLAVQLSAAVVDPPRPGLQPKALQAVIDLNPQRLAYVSCNPESLARDLGVLAPYYRIASAQPVDLFPHTPHVETVVALEPR